MNCCLLRWSVRRGRHTLPSSIWWKTLQWEFTLCWVDLAPTIPGWGAQTTLSWCRNLPAEVSLQVFIESKQRKHDVKIFFFFFFLLSALHDDLVFGMLLVSLSSCRANGYCSPGFQLHFLQYGAYDLQLETSPQNNEQITAISIFLVSYIYTCNNGLQMSVHNNISWHCWMSLLVPQQQLKSFILTGGWITLVMYCNVFYLSVKATGRKWTPLGVYEIQFVTTIRVKMTVPKYSIIV